MYNSELSTIDTPNKAYLIGLIYSDGCIIWKKGQQYSLRIKLNDLDLLESIRLEFPFFSRAA